MASPTTRIADERRRIVAAAAALLADEGPAALTTRRIADAAGVTTMALYSRFGGKEQIVAELYADGFAALRDRTEGVPPGEPRARLLAACQEYRRFAIEQPWRYAVMFERVVGEFQPAGEVRGRAWPALEALRELVAGVTGESVAARAHALWALCHGIVSLELTGWSDASPVDGEALLRRATEDLTSTW